MENDQIKDEEMLENIQQEIDLKVQELEKLKLEIADTKKQLDFVPGREISKDEQVLIDKQITNINKKETGSKVIEMQKAIDNQKVTGRFMNRRAPGQPVKLTYMKYADDPVKWYRFEDGKVYTIPRGFADQINEYYHTPIFVQKEGPQALNENVGDNSMIAEVDKRNKKYAFVAVGF